MNRKTLEQSMPVAADIQAVVGYRLEPEDGGPYIIVATFLLVKDATLFVTAAAPGQEIGEYTVILIED
jgi:hypothetical protein